MKKKLLLSTSNVILGGSAIRRPTNVKSNAELITSLRANLEHHSGLGGGESQGSHQPYKSWTKEQDGVLEIPALEAGENALQEEREQYDITAKLFYLPGASVVDRAAHMREAINLVLKELQTHSLDLLIVSFPGVYFDEEEDCPTKISTRSPVESEPEPIDTQLNTWQALEQLHDDGLVSRLGIAEFGTDRLRAFLDKARVRPSVDQINLRDCCSVPKDLMSLAKSEKVELLVHNDCSNILPRGTVRELLGPAGAGVLTDTPKTGDKRRASDDTEADGRRLTGDVQPQWVIKYTAVIRNRGVVENKGYLAVAEVSE